MNREDIFISGIMTQKIIGQHHGSQLEKIWMNTRANVIMEQLIQEWTAKYSGISSEALYYVPLE